MGEHSESLGALAKALASAQAKLGDAKKDSTNPHFKNKYASLSSVREAITKVLSDAGIAVVQAFEPHGDSGVCVVTTLMHESGEWITSRLFIPVSKKDAQGFGSALTYGRRYALAAIVGIAADDDDDAEASVARDTKPVAKPSVAKPESDKIEAGFAARLDAVKTTDDMAAAEGDISKAVQAGSLSDAARARLRLKRADVIKRLTATNGAAAS